MAKAVALFMFRISQNCWQPVELYRLTRLERPLQHGLLSGVTGRVHTPTMTLKNAALLALIGTILMAALLLWTFVLTFLNVLRGLVPAVTLFSSFIYAFGSFSVAVFFYAFHRAR
jgi:hypothetical protein